MEKVINAMLAMQRYPWEQGVCAQALYEAGIDSLWIPMAYDAVVRSDQEGKLAMVGGGETVSDPAANGEVKESVCASGALGNRKRMGFDGFIQSHRRSNKSKPDRYL